MTATSQVTRPTHEGAVVYRVSEGVPQYLLVQSRDRAPQWVWPSGHIEPGERDGMTAVRETEEETGVIACAVLRLCRREFMRGGSPAVIDYHLCRFTRTTRAHEARASTWVTLEQAERYLTHPDSLAVLWQAGETVRREDGRSRALTRDSPAAELLFREHAALTTELEHNEARGEGRVTMFLTLVTAVIAGLVTLARDGATAQWHRTAVFALAALLGIGIVLYFRLLKRNEKTDGMREDLREIRSIIRARMDPDGLLEGWAPFEGVRQGKSTKSRRFGGLADLAAVLNSIIAGALASEMLAILSDRPDSAAAVGVALFGLSMVVHRWYTRKRGEERQSPVVPIPTRS